MEYISPHNRAQMGIHCLDMLIEADNEVCVIDVFVEALNMAMIGISVTLPREGCSPEKYLIGNKLNPVN